jgi:DNA-binding NtrC family response regulator
MRSAPCAGGLFDYLTKPFRNLDELSAIIDRALEMDRAYREISDLQAPLAARPGRPVIVGRSAVMQKSCFSRSAHRAPGHDGVDRGRKRDGQGACARKFMN